MPSSGSFLNFGLRREEINRNGDLHALSFIRIVVHRVCKPHVFFRACMQGFTWSSTGTEKNLQAREKPEMIGQKSQGKATWFGFDVE